MAFVKQGISTSLGPVEVKQGEKNAEKEEKSTPTPSQNTSK